MRLNQQFKPAHNVTQMPFVRQSVQFSKKLQMPTITKLGRCSQNVAVNSMLQLITHIHRYTAYTTASHTPQLTPTCTIKNIQSKHRQIHNRWNTVDKYGRQIRTQYVQTEVDGKLVRKCLCPHAQRNGQRENIAPLALSTGRVDA